MVIKSEWETEEEGKAIAEYRLQDRVYNLVTLRAFTSYSKGVGRRRRYPKDIQLVKYTDGFHLAKNFHWDKYATEIMGDIEDAEAELIDLVLGDQNRNLNTSLGR